MVNAVSIIITQFLENIKKNAIEERDIFIDTYFKHPDKTNIATPINTFIMSSLTMKLPVQYLV